VALHPCLLLAAKVFCLIDRHFILGGIKVETARDGLGLVFWVLLLIQNLLFIIISLFGDRTVGRLVGRTGWLDGSTGNGLLASFFPVAASSNRGLEGSLIFYFPYIYP